MTIHQTVGKFLYYSISVDLTMMVQLNMISVVKNKSTKKIKNTETYLLNYSSIQLDAKSRYHISVMTMDIIISTIPYF